MPSNPTCRQCEAKKTLFLRAGHQTQSWGTPCTSKLNKHADALKSVDLKCTLCALLFKYSPLRQHWRTCLGKSLVTCTMRGPRGFAGLHGLNCLAALPLGAGVRAIHLQSGTQ